MKKEEIAKVLGRKKYTKTAQKFTTSGYSDVPDFNVREGVNASNAVTVGLILNMALTGDVPDGNFSDFECCEWEMMRRILRSHGVEIGEV